MLGWLPCALLCATTALTVRSDEARAQLTRSKAALNEVGAPPMTSELHTVQPCQLGLL